MTETLLLAATLPKKTLLMIGAAASVVIVLWSFTHWRAAVKVALVTALLEGAIRKWAFPQGQELVYFLKDVFLFGAYLKFFLSPDLDVRAYRLRIPGFVIVLLCVVVGLGALNPNIDSVFLSAFGLKVYFYYLPLVFMMPYLFRTEQEMTRQLTWFALIALPICLLGLVQWQAGPTSILNVYAQREGSEMGASGFGYGMDARARITGTFSYITGHTTFVVFFITLCLVLLTVRETRWKWLFAGVVLPLLGVNALMGGSRASIFVAGFVIVGMALPAFAGRIGAGTYFKTILMGAMAAGALMISYLFYDAYFHMSVRARTAGDTFYERAIEHPYKAMAYAIEKAGFFGYGLGLTHPATGALKNFLQIEGPKEEAVGVESESGQVWIEVGLFGFTAWYALRLYLIWLCWRCYVEAQRPLQKSLSLSAVLLSIPYLTMQLVVNHTANILLFALYGLAVLPRLAPLVTHRQRARVEAQPRLAREV